MQPHAGVQVVIVRLAGHICHGEVYRRTVGDGHCRGHRENKKRDGYTLQSQQKTELNVSSVVGLCTASFHPSRDAQLIVR